MNERDEAEARAVLAELTCLRIDAEPEAMEIAALLRFAARAKAEALREAAETFNGFVDERVRHSRTFVPGDSREDCLLTKASEAGRCADWCVRMAAKLERST
jgi:hypothetical protein